MRVITVEREGQANPKGRGGQRGGHGAPVTEPRTVSRVLGTGLTEKETCLFMLSLKTCSQQNGSRFLAAFDLRFGSNAKQRLS